MYIGNPIYQVAFLTDQFSGNNSTTAFTMSVAPANTASVLIAVGGVLQDPSTYSVSGTTLTFTQAPPTGTGNISARYLGIPASNVTTTAYRTVTNFTATASQTTFTPPSYTSGFINVYRNGVYLPTVDYTATNGTTVVLNNGCAAGDTVTVESFLVSSVLNAIPNTSASVSPSNMTTGAVIQVVQNAINITSNYFTTSNSAPTATGFSVSITPQFSTSRILVQVFANMSVTASSGTSTGAYATIYRGSTNLAGSQSNACLADMYINANQIIAGSANMSILDSPATTSSTTYQVYCGVSGTSSNTMVFGSLPGYPAGSTITIIAQEIR